MKAKTIDVSSKSRGMTVGPREVLERMWKMVNHLYAEAQNVGRRLVHFEKRLIDVEKVLYAGRPALLSEKDRKSFPDLKVTSSAPGNDVETLRKEVQALRADLKNAQKKIRRLERKDTTKGGE